MTKWTLTIGVAALALAPGGCSKGGDGNNVAASAQPKAAGGDEGGGHADRDGQRGTDRAERRRRGDRGNRRVG